MTLRFDNTSDSATLVLNGVDALKINQYGLLTTPITVRQTVELGPVDTSGFSAFGGSTGSTTVTASGTFYLNAANGMVNRRGSITNPSWTGASTNGTMYAYLDIAADGSCTSGLSTLAPTYRWGGADVVTSGQFTFNIQEMQGKVGNGATAVQTYRVYVGDFTVAGNVVTAITWYALMGRYDSGWTNTLPTTATSISKTHAIGIVPEKFKIDIKCLSAAGGFSIGDIVLPYTAGNAAYITPFSPLVSSMVMQFTTGSNQAFSLLHKTTGANTYLTLTDWAYRVTAGRGW